MFEKFTQAARRLIFLARSEAVRTGSVYMGAEHFVLALLKEKDSVILRLLTANDAESLLRDLEARVGTGSREDQKDLPLSPDMKRALAHGAEAASQFGDQHITEEHLLIGLLRVEDAPVTQILMKYQVSEDRVAMAATQTSIQSSSSSASQIDGRVQVTESRRHFEGYNFKVIERIQMKADQSVITYSQEIQGPKKHYRFEVDFDID
jgi:ATP-dependent Clp protease ATP-binding subunit ClpC